MSDRLSVQSLDSLQHGPIANTARYGALLCSVAALALPVSELTAQAVLLRPLDSIRIHETEHLYVGRPNGLAVSERGDVYVSDIADRRVLRIKRSGDLTIVAGRGGGPGEVTSPTAVTLIGDSILVVRNAGRRRLELFDVRTGKFAGGRPYAGASSGMSAAFGQVVMGSLRPDGGTSWALYDMQGEPRLGGTIPAFYAQVPMAASVFAHVEVARDARHVYGVFEVSDWLYRWDIRTQAVDSILLAKGARRGARTDLIDAMFRDQAKARNLAYQWSAPMLIAPVSGNRTAVVFSDPSLSSSVYEGPSFLVIADWKSRRSCREIPLAVPRDVVPRFAIRGDTLVGLVQRANAASESEAWIVRWHIPVADCR